MQRHSGSAPALPAGAGSCRESSLSEVCPERKRRWAALRPMTGKSSRPPEATPRPAGLTSFVLALTRYGRCTLTPAAAPALTGTCPGTLPLSANAAGEEQP